MIIWDSIHQEFASTWKDGQTGVLIKKNVHHHNGGQKNADLMTL